MNKAFVFLSDGNWQKADEHFSNVLKQNPKSGRAYLGKLMAELHVTEECALADCSEPFDNSNNYMEATRYGGDELTSTLNGYLETIRERKRSKDLMSFLRLIYRKRRNILQSKKQQLMRKPLQKLS